MPSNVQVAEKLKIWLDDFFVYAAECLKIRSFDAKLVPFVLNRSQRALWRQIQQLIEDGEPVRVFILKARQMGFSTFVQGLMFWITSLRPFRNALVVSHEDKSVISMFGKAEVFFRFLPTFLQPMRRNANRYEMYFANPRPPREDDEVYDPGLESRIMVQTANNKHLGASQSLDFVHLSELARYEDLLTDVDASMSTLLQTVSYSPGTFVFIETTAQGYGYAKDIWDDPDNGYLKFFASWVADDRYTAKMPLEERELETAEESRYGNEVAVLKLVISELEKWYPEITSPEERRVEALKRLRWRRRVIRQTYRGKLNLFKQDYPISAEEAFQTSGSNVFDTRKLADISSALQGVHPTNYRYDPHAHNFYEAPYGHLRVYEAPQPHMAYVIGGDVGEGLTGSDPSVLQVLKLPDQVQVAVFQDVVRPDELADIAEALGKLYNSAWVGIENTGTGVATNLRLGQTLAYPYLYVREGFDERTKKYTKKLGWSTNRASKPVMITSLRAAIDDDEMVFRDLPTINELQMYTQFKDGTMGAPSGHHDDLVTSLAIALQVAVQRGPIEKQRKDNTVPYGSFEYYARQFERYSGRRPLSPLGF